MARRACNPSGRVGCFQQPINDFAYSGSDLRHGDQMGEQSYSPLETPTCRPTKGPIKIAQLAQTWGFLRGEVKLSP